MFWAQRCETYRAGAGLKTGVKAFGGAGLLKMASSMGTLTFTSVKLKIDCPSVQLATQWKGILMPATSLKLE